MQPTEYLKNKLERVQLVLDEIKSEVNQIEYTNKGYDIHRLLYDEKYRLEVAIKEVKTNEKIAELLKISERTVYRMRSKFNI
jgi:DNA-binding NarL/FixJ family response regulator